MNLTALLKQIGFLVTFLILSWILIHFLALFGVFLALALPLLHLAFYPHIMCFWCRLKGTRHTGIHSIIDSGLILLLTAISIPAVFLEYRLVTRVLNPSDISPLAQFTIPARSQYPVGEVFPVKVELMNIPAAINVAQADLSFDPTIIKVIDVVTDGTFAEFFVQKEHNNDQGYVRITGGIPNPGYRQPSGLLATVYLEGKKPGAVRLQYLETSLVLANDGKGTNLLADFPSIPLIITPLGADSSPSPEDVTIRSQIQGDSDKTVLSFSEYAHELPAPFDDTLGQSSQMDQPIQPSPPPAPTHPSLILRLDQLIISLYTRLFTI